MTINYYAVCNVHGPISVWLEDSESIQGALAQFAAADTRAWIDGARADIEADLGVCGEDMGEAEFDRLLQSRGARPITDLEAADGHHIRNGWYLWAVEL